MWRGVGFGYCIRKRRQERDVGYMEGGKRRELWGGEGGIHGIRTRVTEKRILGVEN